MESIKLNLAEVFSRTPGSRYREEGKFSGEEFRENFLVPILLESIELNKKIEINLDGTAGYGTSFLEEVFGGLIREDNIPYDEINNRLIIISLEEDYLVDDIKQDLIDANNEKNVG